MISEQIKDGIGAIIFGIVILCAIWLLIDISFATPIHVERDPKTLGPTREDTSTLQKCQVVVKKQEFIMDLMDGYLQGRQAAIELMQEQLNKCSQQKKESSSEK